LSHRQRYTADKLKFTNSSVLLNRAWNGGGSRRAQVRAILRRRMKQHRRCKLAHETLRHLRVVYLEEGKGKKEKNRSYSTSFEPTTFPNIPIPPQLPKSSPSPKSHNNHGRPPPSNCQGKARPKRISSSASPTKEGFLERHISDQQPGQ